LADAHAGTAHRHPLTDYKLYGISVGMDRQQLVTELTDQARNLAARIPIRCAQPQHIADHHPSQCGPATHHRHRTVQPRYVHPPFGSPVRVSHPIPPVIELNVLDGIIDTLQRIFKDIANAPSNLKLPV
jgi:hypothetical protein